MKMPYPFTVQDKCTECSWRTEHFSCNLPKNVLEEFNSLKITQTYPKGAALFAQGDIANGVYLLCTGRVKLSTYSKDGKAFIVRVASAGEILGLSANISGAAHEATAHVVDHCQVNFVKRNEFLQFLKDHNEAALNALRELSRNYQKAHLQICSLGLSASASDKLVKLLLEWSELPGNSSADGVHISLTYTQEEIADMIGTSRETVTRLLSDLRRRKLIVLQMSDLHIPDRTKLEATVGVSHRNSPKTLR